MFQARSHQAVAAAKDWPLAVKTVLGFWALHIVYRTIIYAMSGQLQNLLDPSLLIAMAIGKVEDDDLGPDTTTIRFGDLEVYPKALDDEALDALTAIMRADHVLVHVTVGTGPGQSTVYGCDLSREYIAINADYTT